MWSVLLAAFTTACNAVSAAYIAVSGLLTLTWADLTTLWASVHGGILAGGTTVQNFGAAALKSFGGL